MGHYVPHTDEELASMLAFVGLDSLEQLFDCVPEALRLAQGDFRVAAGLSEFDTQDEMERLAAANRGAGLICFAGAGAYDHDISSMVRRVGMRTEFVTAYTPYQPEVAQGVLQVLFEYQTMIARLTGVEIANASLYDGATATVEGVNLAVAATGRETVWLSDGLHRRWAEVVRTFAAGTGHRIETVPLDRGVTAWPDPGEAVGDATPGAVVVQYPNRLGCLDDMERAAAVARQTGALLVVAFDPVAAAMLKSPGEWGADVAVGEGQVFGTPMSFGGPYLGLFAAKLSHVRRVPGRIVGETVDLEGRRAYVTTLRTREQDIRREKASSNVCTNQTLIAVHCALQMSWLGKEGLRELALRCAQGTRYTRDALLAIDGVEPLADAPVFREFAVRLPVAPDLVIERMADEGFLAGVATDDGAGGDGLLIAVTERRTRDEIDAYVTALGKAIR